MTREEKAKAIDALKISAPIMAVTQEEFNDYIQTLNKIMDWLEQKPTTKNDLGVDCIDRNSIKYYPGTGGYMYASKGEINKLPSVTPQEPRKGHWIGHREHCENLGVMPSGLGAYEWCSNCDCGINVREWYKNNYNFCPNCGADMRKMEENNIINMEEE